MSLFCAKINNMQKILILFAISYIILIGQSSAQSLTKDPLLGRRILEEQYENIKAFGGKIDCTNYWNIAVAYIHLDYSKDSVLQYIQMSMRENPKKFLDLVDYSISFSNNDIKETRFYKTLGEQYIKVVTMGKERAKLHLNEEKKITNVKNQKVVQQLINMMEKDSRHRKDPMFFKDKDIQKKQYILDSINMIDLYAIYNEYGYPGKTITGDNEYKDYFCLMVEHGQNKKGEQRFWLPIIAEAFRKGELSAAPLKMLLDRIHWLEHGKQYFGSHLNIPMDTSENIKAIVDKYGF